MPYYTKEGPNVQDQAEHTAYKKMINKQKDRFATKEEKLEVELEYMKAQMIKQARENGGWCEY